MRRRVLYLGWVNHGNLGDEVCRDVFVAQLAAAARGRCEPEVVALYPSGISEQDFRRLRPNLVVLGGGSTLGLPYVGPLVIAHRFGVPTAVWGSGIDRLSDPALAALTRGAPPSLSDIYTDEIFHVREAVNGCSAAGVRGPHTLEVLKLIQSGPPSLEVCGDPGLLLMAGSSDLGSDASGPPEWFGAGDPVIGVNWGRTRNRLYGGSEDRPASLLAQALDRLLPEVRVFLYAVWSEDLTALRVLASRLGQPERVLYHDRVFPAPVLGSLLKKCFFTINLKLHGNVFSAAVGRPFVCLAYSSKAYDFAASVACEALVIRVDEPRLDDLIVDAGRAIQTETARYEATIEAARRTYTAKLTTLAERCVDLVV